MSEIENKIDTFFQSYPEKTYDKGIILVFAGEEPHGVMYLTSGQVIKYEVSPQGEKVIINSFKYPSFFPMSWAINGTKNEYFYGVHERAKIRIAPAKDVLDFLHANPDVTLDLLARVYRGVDGVLRRMAHMMGGSASSRLIHEIIIHAKRFGEKSGENTYTLHVTEAEFANRTGLSRETVNREIQKIKKLNLIERKRGVFNIPDLSKLEDLLGDDL